jgi:pimeloyl-ACP methyl ester carboxylesterase
MAHYAADASAVVEHLDLRNAIYVGHSTGGGEVARYVARYGQSQGRMAKAVLVSAVPPLMLKTPGNPEGTPIEVFDGSVQRLPLIGLSSSWMGRRTPSTGSAAPMRTYRKELSKTGGARA